MKKTFNLLVATTVIATLFLASCDPGEDPEATPASTDPRDKFHGNWAVSENSVDYGNSTYNCTITDSSASPYIFISYLYGFNKKIYANVSASNFSIPTQVIQGNNVSGNATLVSANQINLTYFVQTSISHTDTVTATLTK